MEASEQTAAAATCLQLKKKQKKANKSWWDFSHLSIYFFQDNVLYTPSDRLSYLSVAINFGNEKMVAISASSSNSKLNRSTSSSSKNSNLTNLGKLDDLDF